VIDLFYFPSPNGMKVAIMLEECGFPYNVVEVDIGRGDQFRPEFLRISPNNKIPALVDHDGAEGPVELFESGAILVCLADKAGRLAGGDDRSRYSVLQWLFWQVGGLGRMAGQANHFRAFAPENVDYGIRRYTDEVDRLYGLLELRLEQTEYLAGEYSIADIGLAMDRAPPRAGPGPCRFPGAAAMVRPDHGAAGRAAGF
jgi:GST-like protein